jgi:thiol-disulfide isomerase/thioredoxin
VTPFRSEQTLKILFSECSALAAVLVSLLAPSIGTAQYHTTVSLRIGDPAPPIKVQTWVRGQPVTKFNKGKVYVLDFWATWCGGCIVSFPHISAIAEKYKDRAIFTSIDTYEEVSGKVPDPVAKVADFLKTPQGKNLKLDVCIDGNSKTMWDAWINPLRRSGLPTTFVIDQEGKIAWIDVNLDHLSWVLDQVLDQKWDRKKAAAIMEKKDAIEDLMFKALRSKGDDRKKAWQETLTASEAFEKQFPDRTDACAFFKFMAWLDLDTSKLPDLLEKMAADPLCRYINLRDAAGLSLRRNDLSKRDYLAIAKVQERLLLNEFPGAGNGGKSISAYQQLASTYDKAGELAKAATSIEKAIEMASLQKASADQIKALQETLDKYKTAAGRTTSANPK